MRNALGTVWQLMGELAVTKPFFIGGRPDGYLLLI